MPTKPLACSTVAQSERYDHPSRPCGESLNRGQRAMTSWGHYRSSDDVRRTTALIPQADLAGSRHDVREMPTSDICTAAKRWRQFLSLYCSISSSALASSVGGISMPSPLAVCKLMTNSNSVDL